MKTKRFVTDAVRRELSVRKTLAKVDNDLPMFKFNAGIAFRGAQARVACCLGRIFALRYWP